MHVSPLTPEDHDVRCDMHAPLLPLEAGGSPDDAELLAAVLAWERLRRAATVREEPSSAEVLAAVLAWEEQQQQEMQNRASLRQQTLLFLLTFPDLHRFFEYADEYAYLALTSRLALHPSVLELMARMAHEYEECREVVEDRYVRELADADALVWDSMCELCGLRPGCEWLAHTECWECYSEHTD